MTVSFAIKVLTKEPYSLFLQWLYMWERSKTLGPVKYEFCIGVDYGNPQKSTVVFQLGTYGGQIFSGTLAQIRVMVGTVGPQIQSVVIFLV